MTALGEWAATGLTIGAEQLRAAAAENRMTALAPLIAAIRDDHVVAWASGIGTADEPLPMQLIGSMPAAFGASAAFVVCDAFMRAGGPVPRRGELQRERAHDPGSEVSDALVCVAADLHSTVGLFAPYRWAEPDDGSLHVACGSSVPMTEAEAVNSRPGGLLAAGLRSETAISIRAEHEAIPGGHSSLDAITAAALSDGLAGVSVVSVAS